MYRQDLISQNLTGQGISKLHDAVGREPAFGLLREYRWQSDMTFALNLQWPTASQFPIPKAQQIVLSFHTEQIDHEFVKTVAISNPDSEVIVLYDGEVRANGWWPNNIKFIRFITWHTQIANIITTWGVPVKAAGVPRYSLSALSFRCTQMKTYVLGSLIDHACRNNFVLSWHVVPGYSVDNHVWRGTSRPKLDALAEKMRDLQQINADTWYNLSYNHPMQNADWRHPAYENCAFNITNESWHYSLTEIDGCEFVYPGPYFTEKTWKPLLAGNGIVCAGQWHSYQALIDLGFRFDYGLDLSYDLIPGDLDRAIAMLDIIQHVASLDALELHEISHQSATHNQQHILSGDFASVCEHKNVTSLDAA